MKVNQHGYRPVLFRCHETWCVMSRYDEGGELAHIGPYAIVPAWVYSHPDLNDSAVRVYGVLATFANAERCAWPSRALIGERCGKDVGTVGRALKVLVDAGALTIEQRKWDDSGKQRPSVYRLAVFDPRGQEPERDIDEPGRDIANSRSAISRKPEARYRASKNITIRTKPEEQNTRANVCENTQPALIEVDGLTPAANDFDRFQEFWSSYPRKIGKPKAQAAWKRLTKAKVDPQTIIDGCERWATYYAQARTEQRFIPHPTTWLNDARYDDTPEPVSNARASHPTRAPIVERTGETMNMKMVGGKLVPA